MMCERDMLLKEIELLRDKMIKTALAKGFTCAESVMISQELDQLINYYHKTHMKKQVKNTKY